jgi:hypothetical protein
MHRPARPRRTPPPRRLLCPSHWLRLALAAGAMVGLVPLASACDYPETGFYALAGLDEEAQQVVAFPFMVEEITDDTQMTIGYRLLLPGKGPAHSGELIEVPVTNGKDLTRRTWEAVIAAADSGLGDLKAGLEHEEERLTFTGTCRTDPDGVAYRLRAVLFPGPLPKSSRVEFTTTVPALPDGTFPAQWVITSETQRDFEKVLGVPVAKAKRIKATAPEPSFSEASESPQDAPAHPAAGAPSEAGSQDSGKQDNAGAGAKKKKEKPKAPPNLGGRTGTRPR